MYPSNKGCQDETKQVVVDSDGDLFAFLNFVVFFLNKIALYILCKIDCPHFKEVVDNPLESPVTNQGEDICREE